MGLRLRAYSIPTHLEENLLFQTIMMCQMAIRFRDLLATRR